MNKYQEALSEVIRMCAQSDELFPTEEVEALQELVDRATPKKPVNWKAERRPNGRVEFNCPVCNRLYNERVNFCASCGQAIDWSEE